MNTPEPVENILTPEELTTVKGIKQRLASEGLAPSTIALQLITDPRKEATPGIPFESKLTPGESQALAEILKNHDDYRGNIAALLLAV